MSAPTMETPVLLVRLAEASAVDGGKAVQLCDADGKPLPNQFKTCLTHEAGERSTLTVSFAVDGKVIKLSD